MHVHPRRLFSVNSLLCDLEIYRSAIRQQFNSESLITFFIGCYHYSRNKNGLINQVYAHKVTGEFSWAPGDKSSARGMPNH